jgi:hypothetical protein
MRKGRVIKENHKIRQNSYSCSQLQKHVKGEWKGMQKIDFPTPRLLNFRGIQSESGCTSCSIKKRLIE